MTDLYEVKDVVDELSEAWIAFKEENGKGRKADQEKLARIGKRLDQLEVAMRRPRTGGLLHRTTTDPDGRKDYGPDGEKFFEYLRYGTHEESQLGGLSAKALRAEDVKELVVGNDPSAGYLAPREFAREIIKAETEFSPIRTVARVRTTSRQAIQLPKRTGQHTALWTAESGTRSETTGLAYGLEELPSHELYALVDVSQQMLEDSEFDLEEELRMEFGEQFGVAEGAAFVNGTGVGQPEGFMTNGDVASTNSGSASTIADSGGEANGIIDLYHAVKTAYARNGTWLLNRSTLGAVRKLKDDQGNYIWQPGLADLRPNTILGQPYVEVPDMPDEAANAFPIIFGDFRRAYTIVDRVQLSVLRDPFTQATSGRVRFLARRRVGGQVVLAEAIRKLKVSA